MRNIARGSSGASCQKHVRRMSDEVLLHKWRASTDTFLKDRILKGKR